MGTRFLFASGPNMGQHGTTRKDTKHDILGEVSDAAQSLEKNWNINYTFKVCPS